MEKNTTKHVKMLYFKCRVRLCLLGFAGVTCKIIVSVTNPDIGLTFLVISKTNWRYCLSSLLMPDYFDSIKHILVMWKLSAFINGIIY